MGESNADPSTKHCYLLPADRNTLSQRGYALNSDAYIRQMIEASRLQQQVSLRAVSKGALLQAGTLSGPRCKAYDGGHRTPEQDMCSLRGYSLAGGR